MNILTSKLYEKQLKELLESLAKQDYQQTKSFKIYLDTIVLNIPSKAKKYKKSIYFDDDNIKDVNFQGCTIIFLIDEKHNSYIILGITVKS